MPKLTPTQYIKKCNQEEQLQKKAIDLYRSKKSIIGSIHSSPLKMKTQRKTKNQIERDKFLLYLYHNDNNPDENQKQKENPIHQMIKKVIKENAIPAHPQVGTTISENK